MIDVWELPDVSSPRIMSIEERSALVQWLAAAPHGVSAYVSQRHTDDPSMAQRIVVTIHGVRHPLYSVHCPIGADFWIVTSLAEASEIGLFPSLRAAPNFVRQALVT
jgi:hypothetical protein